MVDLQADVITIDGPGGTGKGTIAHMLAVILGWHFLDSGALYRVLAVAAKKHGVSQNDEPGLKRLTEQLDVVFVTLGVGIPPRITLEGVDVTEEIRSEEAGNLASLISMLPSVRAVLLDRQRAFCQPPGLVTDGRDMGTVVFPDAKLKLYLDASTNARARRRFEQLKAKGISVNLAQVLIDIETRDARDKNRAIAPLKPAVDAILIDTTDQSIDQVFETVLALVRSRLKLRADVLL